MADIKTGDIVLVDLSNAVGHQQGGIRPAVVVSNNVGNCKSPTVTILPGTSQRIKSTLPTHAHFDADEIKGLTKQTTFEAESEITIDKRQIRKYIAHMTDEQLERIADAMLFATPLILKAFNKGTHFSERFEKIANFS